MPDGEGLHNVTCIGALAGDYPLAAEFFNRVANGGDFCVPGVTSDRWDAAGGCRLFGLNSPLS